MVKIGRRKKKSKVTILEGPTNDLSFDGNWWNNERWEIKTSNSNSYFLHLTSLEIFSGDHLTMNSYVFSTNGQKLKVVKTWENK